MLRLLNGAAALNAAGQNVDALKTRRDLLPYQVSLGGGTATVTLQARVNPTSPWMTVRTDSADAIAQVPSYPYFRAVVTAFTSGTIHAAVDAQGSPTFNAINPT